MALPLRNLSSLERPNLRNASRRRLRYLRRLFSFLAVAQGLFPAVPTFLNLVGPEKTVFGIVQLYLPPWLWGLPALLLVLPTLRYAPRRLWLIGLSLLWTAGPVMGFCWHSAPIAAKPTALTLRLMTYNVKWGKREISAIASEIGHYQPDILVMQDSAGVLQGPLLTVLKGYQVKTAYQCTVASRYPILYAQPIALATGDTNYQAMQIEVRVGHECILIYNVHLLSPRWALLDLLDGNTSNILASAAHREQQAQGLLNLLHSQKGPVLVAGDFNSPPSSLVCRILEKQGHLQDAFAEAGQGYGYTYGQYLLPHFVPFLRIDHIFADQQWRVLRCVTGNGKGSDHCPVIADLVLRR